MFIAIVTQLEIWLVGIPILVIVDNVSADADATYLGHVLLIFSFAVTMVLTVIGSKFVNYHGWCISSESGGSRYTGGNGTRVSGTGRIRGILQDTNRGGRTGSVTFADADKAVIVNRSSATSTADVSHRSSDQTIEQPPEEARKSHVDISRQSYLEAVDEPDAGAGISARTTTMYEIETVLVRNRNR